MTRWTDEGLDLTPPSRADRLRREAVQYYASRLLAAWVVVVVGWAVLAAVMGVR